MPLTIDPRDRKLLIGAALIFVVLIVATVIFGGPGGQKLQVPSTYSSASGGAKAAYLLLSGSGYKVERWEKPLNQLPPTAATLILAEPIEAPTRQDRERLKAFISAGGRIIATGMFAGTFLPENSSVPDFVGAMTWKKAPALAPSDITRAAPEIKLAPEARWLDYSPAYALYGTEDQTLVVKYPYGKGEVLWWASATPLTNAGMKEKGNLEFFLACLGGSSQPILWDEYIHGYRETLALSIAHSPVKWLALQLSLLALAVLATFSRRSGPVCKPATDLRLSPLEFVQTLGGLYERAATASVAVDICYQRFRYWLTRRLGVGANVSNHELETAVRERWSLNDDHFAAILRRCESAKNDPYLQAPEALHLVQELDSYGSRLRLFQTGRKENAE
ncbi:MAG TPA: DUF4350 domain-containing protein [Candidatus Sulfotelmatobacter sp.]|nr:DUF4350 domain-containing protein [Candidatus Sulfotelmatobacter sp.]